MTNAELIKALDDLRATMISVVTGGPPSRTCRPRHWRFVAFSQHAPGIDVRELKDEQLKMLASTYDAIADLELKQLSKLAEDEVRIRIDEAISKALGLPGVGAIRELLAREPGLSAQEINPREGEKDDMPDEEPQAALL
jgi:hypothetical protein